jgi:hypothetical protein
MVPPSWVADFIAVVAGVRPLIDTAKVHGLTSNKVLAAVKPGLEALGYAVEDPATKQKLRRPVLFGDNGAAEVRYDVDAVHDALGIVVEIEAGRGARSNALYRDLIRASLIVNTRFLVIGVMQTYRHQNLKKKSTVLVEGYGEAKRAVDAVYASGRLVLPVEGLLLFGY